jgi:catechol 2,3-dioxygenase-like lactoylglutathione lyase family enzyme
MQLNHTIVYARDKAYSSAFLAEILGRSAPISYGPFAVVAFDNGVSLDFWDVRETFDTQHYAFLITEAEFDAVSDRIKARGLLYWADPGRQRLGEFNRNDGGRGLYFDDPDGHLLEVLTVPYGVSAENEASLQDVPPVGNATLRATQRKRDANGKGC